MAAARRLRRVGWHRRRHLRHLRARRFGWRRPGFADRRHAVRIVVALAGGAIVYGSLKASVGLRLDEDEEFIGADLSIHRIPATPND